MTLNPSVCGGYGIPGPPGSMMNSWQGTWSPGQFYTLGDLVEHEGSVYLYGPDESSLPVYGAEPPEHPWQLFARRGSDGDTPGTALNWRGMWMGDETYTEGSVVEHLGSSYAAALDAPQGTAPPESPWELVAAEGDPGPPPQTHWAGWQAIMSTVPSGVAGLVPLTGPLAGSDPDFYDVLGSERISVKQAGVYRIDAYFTLTLPAPGDPAAPALRLFHLLSGGQPVGGQTDYTSGQAWAAGASRTLLLGVGDEVSFSFRQDSGSQGSGSANVAITYAGS